MASTTEALRTVAEELAAAERERDYWKARAEKAERERGEARDLLSEAWDLLEWVIHERHHGPLTSETKDEIRDLVSRIRAARESGGGGDGEA